MLLDYRRKSLMAASHKPPPLTPARLEADQALVRWLVTAIRPVQSDQMVMDTSTHIRPRQMLARWSVGLTIYQWFRIGPCHGDHLLLLLCLSLPYRC